MARYLVVFIDSSQDERQWCEIGFAFNGLSSSIVLPYKKGIRYFIRIRDSGVSSFHGEGVDVREISRLAYLRARWRGVFLNSKDACARFDHFDVFFEGDKAARRVVSGAVRRLRKSGASLDGPSFRRFPELLTGWASSPPVAMKTKIDIGQSIAVVVHIYYEEIWNEILALLDILDLSIDIIVTVPSDKLNIVEKIAQTLPRARIVATENSGKDVRPFLLLLEQGELDSYKYICKIHGKKSADDGRTAILGTIWRNRMLFDLLAAPGIIEAIIARFGSHPNVGMIGPRAYRYPSSLCSVERSWGSNRASVLGLAAQLGIAEHEYRLDFFCGTMFWIRSDALLPLRRLGLAKRFKDERGRTDGELEHAVERLFSTSARCAGYDVEGVSGRDATFSRESL